MTYMIPFNRPSRKTVPVRYNSVSNMIDDFFSDMWSPSMNTQSSFKIDVQDKDSSYLIEADLPGVNKDEINLELEENTLRIQVKREETAEEEQGSYIHKERKYSSMSRSIYLRDVKADEIDAKLENGVLTVSVPKIAKSEKIRQIEIG